MLTALICKYNGRWLRGQPRGQVDGRNSGAAAEAPGCEWCRWRRPGAVTTLWEGWYPPHHCCAATRSRRESTLHRRPNPGHCPSPDSSGAVVTTLLRQGRDRGNDQLLSRSARRVPTSRRQRRRLSGGAAASAGTVRARRLVQAGTRRTTPSSRESSRDNFVDILETVSVRVPEKVPETTSLIFSEKVPETTSLIFLETVLEKVPETTSLIFLEKVPETTLLIF